MGMHNPPRSIRAVSLGVTRQALSELVNERTGMVEMAIRLSKAFGSTPETWLGMQMAWDLWQARERAGRIAVERFAADRCAGAGIVAFTPRRSAVSWGRLAQRRIRGEGHDRFTH